MRIRRNISGRRPVGRGRQGLERGSAPGRTRPRRRPRPASADDAVGRRDDLAGTPSTSTAPSVSPARTRVPAATPDRGWKIPDGRRGRDERCRPASSSPAIRRDVGTAGRHRPTVTPLDRSRRPSPRPGREPAATVAAGRRARAPRPAVRDRLSCAAALDRSARRRHGRRRRTCQSPSRTSSSPRPVVPELRDQGRQQLLGEARDAGVVGPTLGIVRPSSRSRAPRALVASGGLSSGTDQTSSFAGAARRVATSPAAACPSTSASAASSRSRRRSASPRPGWAATTLGAATSVYGPSAR